MKMNAKVSILIPCYNSENYIVDTLESCLSQTYKNIEVIVVDDGSTDRSLELANEYASKYASVYVYSQSKRGAQNARNLAFTKSTGEYIQYLDADDLLDKNKILSQMEVLANEKNEVIAFSQCRLFTNIMAEELPTTKELR